MAWDRVKGGLRIMAIPMMFLMDAILLILGPDVPYAGPQENKTEENNP